MTRENNPPGSGGPGAGDHGGQNVAVTVNYQSKSETMDFARRATVEEVLLWAIRVFKIDSAMATEFELAKSGEVEEISGRTRIASLAAGSSSLALDLVRGDIANGHI